MTLQQRDALLQENWYIACMSKDIKSKRVFKTTIYDKNLILFRNSEDKIVCLIDRCLHRHAPLSAGTLQNGHITCPYHGWTFDCEGKIAKIPSEDTPCSRYKQKVETFSVIEQDNFVWVWMGTKGAEKKKTPFSMPYDKGWTHYVMETTFDNEVTHLAENFMDVPHTPYVHKGWFRDVQSKKVNIKVETKNGGVLVTYDTKDDKIGFINKLLNPHKLPLIHTDHFLMPNITKVDYRFGQKTGFTIISQCTPISTLKTKVYTAIIYRVVPSLDKIMIPFMNWYTRVVIEQDVKIMKIQGANISNLEKPNFIGGKADIIHHEIEKLRKLGCETDDGFNSIERQKETDIWI